MNALEAAATRHIPALDGLRGIAIISVMLFHYCVTLPQPVPAITYYGYVGVDLFFVLSGFLIGGILIDTRGCAGYFKTFYIRRVLRIFPAYYVYLAAVGIFGQGHHDYWLYCTYLQNWGTGGGAADGRLSHLWSLAVEEQFYLCWPIVVWLTPARALPWLCSGMTALTLLARILASHYLSADEIWRLTPFRLDALCLGTLMACSLRSPGMSTFMGKWGLWIGAASGLAYACVQRPGIVRPVSYTLSAIAFAALVLYAASRNPAVLQWKPLRVMGKYSYAMYLWHLAVIPFHWLPNQSLTVRVLCVPLMMLLTFGLAVLSFYLIERPFLRLKAGFPYAAGSRPLAGVARQPA